MLQLHLDSLPPATLPGFKLDAAVLGGRLEVLRWLHEDAGLALDDVVMRACARTGRLNILEFCRNRGCWSVDRVCCARLTGDAALHGQLEALQWLTAQSDWQALRNGHTHVAEWLHQQHGFLVQRPGQRIQLPTLAAAGAGPTSAAMEWVAAHGEEINEKFCARAASAGRLANLRWLRARGVPWGDGVATNAAFSGRLRLLQWAVAEGCPMDAAACKLAAGSHTHVIAWIDARERRNQPGNAADPLRQLERC